MLKLFRSPKNWILDVYILLFLLVCGSSQVAHGLCEVPSMKVLTRGMMKEHWWGSMTWVSSWPFIPCYAGHRPLVTKLTHVLVLAMYVLSFDFGRRVDPFRFSLIFRFPMAYGADVVLQQFAFGNAAALRIGGHKFSCRANFVWDPAMKKEVCKFCNWSSGRTEQGNRIWAFRRIYSDVMYILSCTQPLNLT